MDVPSFQKIEWVRLLETYPDDFKKAQTFERISNEFGKTYGYIRISQIP